MIRIFLIFFIYLYSIIVFAQRNNLQIVSPAFDNNSTIPTKYTCNGKNISPPIFIQNEIKNGKSMVLIMDDPDAPSGLWTHWVIYNLPPSETVVAENYKVLSGVNIGKNSWGKSQYDGPCPPSGKHRYFFKLYILDIELPKKDLNLSDIKKFMQNHVLGTATLIGAYSHK